MKNRIKPESIFKVFNYLFLTFLAVTSIYPLLYTITISLSTTAEAIKPGLHIFPREVTLQSYKMVLSNKYIFLAYGNTIFRTIVGTLLSVLVTAMMAYPLSKEYMPNKKIYMRILIFTMLFNGGTIPTYLLIKGLNLLDNRLVYIIPGLVTAYNVIIIKNYFNSIPEALSESAKIDGANEFLIFFKIMLPLSKPVLATVVLWTAVAHWNSWLDGILYVTDNEKQVLQIYLQRIVTQNQQELIRQGSLSEDVASFTNETIKSASIIVTILPILCVYPFLQKYFVKGIMLGSIKG